MYVEKIRGHRIGSVPTAAGSKMPLYCTALGKTLLAGEPDSVMEETIERGLRPLTSHTLTTGTHLRRDVDSARIDGVAFDREESVPGLTCVSAPILGLDNRVAAALSVSTNIRRLPRVESLAPLVTVAARGISELLGASRRTAGVPVRVP
jgi:DNA-binding IclR family transcriptional regulator